MVWASWQTAGASVVPQVQSLLVEQGSAQ